MTRWTLREFACNGEFRDYPKVEVRIKIKCQQMESFPTHEKVVGHFEVEYRQRAMRDRFHFQNTTLAMCIAYDT
jgi:hypothetical protein